MLHLGNGLRPSLPVGEKWTLTAPNRAATYANFRYIRLMIYDMSSDMVIVQYIEGPH